MTSGPEDYAAIHFSILMLETFSNLLQREYSVKSYNTETVILSLGDTNEDKTADLEIIRDPPPNSATDKKWRRFHKFVNLVQMTENPRANYIFHPQEALKPTIPVNASGLTYEIIIDKKNNKKTLRRKKFKWKRRNKNKKPSDPEEGKKTLTKRQADSNETKPEELEEDYLQKEYLDYVHRNKNSNRIFKYSNDGKPEENFRDVFEKIFDLRTPENCTNVKGIGVQALECVIKKFKTGGIDKHQLTLGVLFILLAWFGIYLIFALPLWCTKGWCFCCCRCKSCFPDKMVKEIQEYIAQFPPGVGLNSKGYRQNYTPTKKETELYEKLKRSIAEY